MLISIENMHACKNYTHGRMLLIESVRRTTECASDIAKITLDPTVESAIG